MKERAIPCLIFSAEKYPGKPGTFTEREGKARNRQATTACQYTLEEKEIAFKRVQGCYNGTTEESFLVPIGVYTDAPYALPYSKPEVCAIVARLARLYNQQSILLRREDGSCALLDPHADFAIIKEIGWWPLTLKPIAITSPTKENHMTLSAQDILDLLHIDTTEVNNTFPGGLVEVDLNLPLFAGLREILKPALERARVEAVDSCYNEIFDAGYDAGYEDGAASVEKESE
jgi:hypothetical protein